MGLELACHELLIHVKQWRRLFRNLDPLAEPFFRLRRRFPTTRFTSIRSLKSPVLVDIFEALPHSLR